MPVMRLAVAASARLRLPLLAAALALAPAAGKAAARTAAQEATQAPSLAQDSGEAHRGAPPALSAPPPTAEPGPPEGPDAPDPPIGMRDILRGRDFLAVGFGLALAPTYAGSNDYTPLALPVAFGSLSGVRINPRGGGLALDLVPDPAEGVGLDAGIVGRLRVDRAGPIGDEVVARLDRLDMAIELGLTVGARIPHLLNPYDSLMVNFDVLRDLNGAHGGLVFSPNLNYATPLGLGVFANLTVSSEFSGAAFQDYYFRISAQDALRTGLPVFEPRGAGFTRVGAMLLLAFDLDGDLRNGGWSVVTVSGYSRMLGDAAETPLTRLRGNPNQLVGALGIGYLF